MTRKRVAFFFIYFIAALAVFAVLRFPHQTAAVKLSQMAETLFPKIRITLDQVSLTPPVGLRTQKPKIRLYDVITVIPDDLRLFIPISAVLGLKKSLHFESSLLNGAVKGHLTGISISPPDCSGLQMSITGLQVRDLPTTIHGIHATLSFALSGQYRISDRRANPTGNGNLALSRVTCLIEDDFLNTLGIKTLDFDQVTATLERHHQTIDILELHATGDIMTVTAAGQVTLINGRITEPANWIFDIKGNLFPKPAHVSRFSTILSMDTLFKTHPEKGIPFTLTGPANALEINR